MAMNTKKRFTKELLELLERYTGCGIQQGGCPCNTCFFGLMGKLGLPPSVSVGFWRSALLLRGDYREEEINRMVREERKEEAAKAKKPLEAIIRKLKRCTKLNAREQRIYDNLG